MDPSTQQPKLTVAYIVHTFDMGGLERCVARLVNHLDRERFAPIIICLNRSGDAADWLTATDVPILELGKRSGNDWRVVRRLSHVLKMQQIDIVHSHNWGTLLETTVARRLAGTAYHVHAEHGQQVAAMTMGRTRLSLHRAARRWAFKRLDALVACARSVSRRVASLWCYPESQIQYIPNGVEEPTPLRESARKLHDIREQLGLEDTAMVVGSVGRLALVKDFGNAIEAITMLANSAVDIHLVLVGDGPERERLKSLAEIQGVGNRIHFVGWQENVDAWLRAFDVYVNSSASEAMSLSILEAMAAGLPIAATDVGDSRDVIDGESPAGLVVEPGSSSELASAIHTLLTVSDLREQMGRNASDRFVSCYSIDRMVNSYSRLYRAVASAEGGSSDNAEDSSTDIRSTKFAMQAKLRV